MEEDKLYQRMYLSLFNAVTDALLDLSRGNVEEARRRLIQAQQNTEEQYISQGEPS